VNITCDEYIHNQNENMLNGMSSLEYVNTS